MTTRPDTRIALEAAYRGATYRIDAAVLLRLTIDAHDPLLDHLLELHRVDSAALLTAANPRSQLRTAAENEPAHQQLQRRLAMAAIRTLPACSQDPAGLWPDEPGVLALGIDHSFATTLAAEFSQNAFVWCARTQAPRLVWVASD